MTTTPTDLTDAHRIAARVLRENLEAATDLCFEMAAAFRSADRTFDWHAFVAACGLRSGQDAVVPRPVTRTFTWAPSCASEREALRRWPGRWVSIFPERIVAFGRHKNTLCLLAWPEDPSANRDTESRWIPVKNITEAS